MGQHSHDLAQGERERVEPFKTTRTCPECGSTDTRLSKRGGILVALVRVLNMSRYRCKTCGRRFFAAN